jgi:hypothetical protein
LSAEWVAAVYKPSGEAVQVRKVMQTIYGISFEVKHASGKIERWFMTAAMFRDNFEKTQQTTQ